MNKNDEAHPAQKPSRSSEAEEIVEAVKRNLSRISREEAEKERSREAARQKDRQ